MKKITRYFAVIVALMVSVMASATNFTFVEGRNVLNANDMVVNGTYTVKATGKVLLEAASSFDEVSCNGKYYSHSWAPGGTHGAYRYEVDAEAGQVIKVFSSFFLNSGTSLWITEMGSGPIPVKLESTSPAQGAVFSWSQAGTLSATFNKPVLISSIKMMTPDNTTYEVQDVVVSNSVSCNVKNALSQAFEDGKLAQGQMFRIRIEGLCDAEDKTNLYDNTGILVLKFVAPALQGTMTSATVNGTTLAEGSMNTYKLKSFYDPEGTDGVFVFTFDKGVKSVAAVVLRMGILDRSTEGLYHESKAPYSIDGNKLIVDLRGELRSYARLFPGVDLEAADVMTEVAFHTICLSLTQVVDVNGNVMASPGQGSVGSFSFNMGYEELEDDIVMDGDREEDCEGSVKNVGDDVQLWIDQQLKSIESLAVYFKVVDAGQGTDSVGNPIYIEGSAKIPVAQIETLMSDPMDGTVIKFTIPELKATVDGVVEEAAAGQPLRIVLQVKTMNGMPHDLIITYSYKEDPTAVDAIIGDAWGTSDKDTVIYNLNGQRVMDTRCRGVYIIGGKKVLR